MYVIANWKENLTVAEAERWVEELNKELGVKNKGGVEVVVCPPSVLLPVLRPSSIFHLPSFHLGAQDVSQFEEGQYTGEVSAKMLSDFVSYVIVGHSERRKYFGETDGDVRRKIEQCLKYDLTPIVCVSRMHQVSGVSMVSGVSRATFAYEPLFAVGTGTPDTPENANEFAKKIKNEVGQDARILYGGSVTSKNAKSFVSQPDISGVLVGEASLDASEFARICHEIY